MRDNVIVLFKRSIILCLQLCNMIPSWPYDLLSERKSLSFNGYILYPDLIIKRFLNFGVPRGQQADCGNKKFHDSEVTSSSLKVPR